MKRNWNHDDRMVLLLSANYMPLDIITWRRAITFMYVGKVDLVYSYDNGDPSVLRLNHTPNFSGRIRFSRKSIFLRDEYTCQYCAKRFSRKAKGLTIDHIIPKSKGGKNIFENVVACCGPCNSWKGDTDLELSGMNLLKQPKEPHPFIYILNKARHFAVDESWNYFLNFNQ